MSATPLSQAIARARSRLRLTRREYAIRLGITPQALRKIEVGGGVNGDTLARLQEYGGLRVTRALVASLRRAA